MGARARETRLAEAERENTLCHGGFHCKGSPAALKNDVIEGEEAHRVEQTQNR